jgi:hypothetical protein
VISFPLISYTLLVTGLIKLLLFTISPIFWLESEIKKVRDNTKDKINKNRDRENIFGKSE